MREITDIGEKQDILYRILEVFNAICKKHGLTYWISNGTLLGAVKYNDFIPWDDDVDVMMPREDYQKLVLLDNAEFRDFRLICRDKEPSWKYPYAKLSDNSTIERELSFNLGCEYGLSVDVFPVDAWRGKYKLSCFQARICGLLCRFLYTSTAQSFECDYHGVKRIVKWSIYIISKCLGSDFFRKKIERESRRGSDNGHSEYVGSISWAPYGVSEVLLKDWVSSLTEIEFHGGLYPAPSGYHEYLTNLYGDYSKDPPVDKQVSNHPMKVWKK